jgi:hypothetical protein
MKNKYTKEKQLVKDLIKNYEEEIKQYKQEIKSYIVWQDWHEVKHLENVNDSLAFAVDEIKDFVNGCFDRNLIREFNPKDLKWVLKSIKSEIKSCESERRHCIKHKAFLHVPAYESQITCFEYVIDDLNRIFKNV